MVNCKIVLYFSSLIKIKRKEKGLSLENLSVLASIDKGYISKIENKIVHSSLENLANILDKLGVELIFEESILNQMNEKLDKLYYDIVYLNNIDKKQINETIFSQENKYIFSLIVDKYLIIKYAYLVTTNSDKRIILSLEHEIEQKFIQNNIIDLDLLQIYYDYKGIELKKDFKLDEAIEILEKSKSIGYHKYSYGMVCYHLTIIYCRKNNYLEAYNNVKESIMIFLKEFNYKRQQYSQINLANIYSISKLYTKADELYRELLKCDSDDEFKWLVQLNLVWNLIKQQHFSKAIVELLAVNEKNRTNLKWYYFLSWCYYKTNENDKLSMVIKESDTVCLDDSTNRKKIEVIRYLTMESDNKVKLNLIREEYQNNLINMDSEDEKFYLEVLIEECYKNGYYKEANKYLNKLVKL